MNLEKKIWQYLLLFFLAFIWGSSFILMKRGMKVYSHDEVAALRIVISFLFLLPFLFKYIHKVKKDRWKYLAIVGVFGSGIPAFLFTLAETEITSSLAGMLNSLTPFFTLILGVVIFKVPAVKGKFLGVFIGLIGAFGLVISNGFDIENTPFVYALLVVIATLCYALSVNTIKKYLSEINSIAITALSFLIIGIPAIIYLFFTDFVATTQTNPEATTALGYVAILAVIGTALSIIIFNQLIKYTSAVFASTVTYLIPIFAIFWGVIDGEEINFIQIVSIFIILVGIYFVNKIK
jgi:drug/metabolite transporter (DMT)-like permease